MESNQTKIFLDKALCDAILNEKKTTIRCIENLEYINTHSEGFSLKKIDIKQGALFNIVMKDICDILELDELKIEFPYKLGEKIRIIEKETNKHRFNLILNSVYIQRFREIDNRDAIDEGFSVYDAKIKDLEVKYPGCDAELILMQEYWEKLYNNPKGKNIWTWVFGFKFDGININATATSKNLTDEQIERLLNIAF